jgi:hypothetical protein
MLNQEEKTQTYEDRVQYLAENVFKNMRCCDIDKFCENMKTIEGGFIDEDNKKNR